MTSLGAGNGVRKDSKAVGRWLDSSQWFCDWYGRGIAQATEPAEQARGQAMVEAAMTDFRALGMVVHAGLAVRWLREEHGR